MDGEHLLPPVVAHLVDRRVERVARVVDDDVDLAEGVDRGLDELVGARRRRSGRRRRRRCRPSISLAVCSATSASRSLIRTLAPWLLSSSAVARPMPRAEPVTIATLSSRTPIALSRISRFRERGTLCELCERPVAAAVSQNAMPAGAIASSERLQAPPPPPLRLRRGAGPRVADRPRRPAPPVRRPPGAASFEAGNGCSPRLRRWSTRGSTGWGACSPTAGPRRCG